MSDKAAKKTEEHGDKPAAKGGGMLAMLTKTPVLLGVIMVAEAGALLVGFKLIMGGGPQEAEAVLIVPAEEAAAADDAHAKDDGHGGKEAAAKDDGHGAKDAKAKDDGHGAKDAHAKDDGHGAKDAHGKDAGGGGGKHAKGVPVEVPVVDLRAPNKLSGRTFIYDVSIFAVVSGENAEKFAEVAKSREATIRDRIRTIIAQLEPDRLGGGSEPGLETLRRQIKYQMEEIVGPGLIVEILVARCIPFRADL